MTSTEKIFPDLKCFAYDPSAKQLFTECFDQKPFLFSHLLHANPLFGIPALRRLSAQMTREETERGFFRIHNQTKGLQWGTGEFQAAVDQAFADIDHSEMRLKLSRIHVEPEYSEVLAACSHELTQLTGIEVAKAYRDPLVTVFISSPNEITPFHVDGEANFLLQISGTKTVHIFDGKDRELLAWTDLEEYYSSGRIRLRKEYEARGMRFELKPGIGVHNPVNFPHWVQNGPTPSISVSIAFTREDDPIDVLRLNRCLRKLRLDPLPPGKNTAFDAAKRGLVRSGRKLKRLFG